MARKSDTKVKVVRATHNAKVKLDKDGLPLYGYNSDGTPRKRPPMSDELKEKMNAARHAAMEQRRAAGTLVKRQPKKGKIENIVKGFTRSDQEQIFYMFKLVLIQGSLEAGKETLEEMIKAKRRTPFGLVFQVLMEALTNTDPKERFKVLMEIVYLCVGKPTVRAEILNEGSPLLAIQNNYLTSLPEELKTQLATAMQDDMERHGKTKEDYRDFPMVQQIIDDAK